MNPGPFWLEASACTDRPFHQENGHAVSFRYLLANSLHRIRESLGEVPETTLVWPTGIIWEISHRGLGNLQELGTIRQ